MLHGILAILIIILIVVFVAVLVVVRFVYSGINRLRDAARSAMGMGGGTDGRGPSGNGRRSGSSRSAGGQRRTYTRGSSGETIIDGRDPEQVQRKIFAADEGEYVDFEEEN